ASYLPTVLSRQPDENPAVPSNQTFPQQERGIRLARALPYALEAAGSVQSDGSFRIDFLNTGDAPAVFQVRSGDNATTPRTYTVEPGKSLADAWPVSDSRYDLSVYGPNGFFRGFQGGTGGGSTNLAVRAESDGRSYRIELEIENLTSGKVIVHLQ